ncbi:MAG TPA: xanthine dehydrogenase family protein subunit M [Candidatus Limnocylindrales bacterium]
MIPAAFAYDRPATLDEAIGLLSRHGGAKLLAGGQSLLPLMKLRLATADRLIDIGRIAELHGIRDLGGGSTGIGALTTYREILDSTTIAERFPVLIEVVDGIADVQVRNRGTIGGGVAHADPASDMPAMAIALDAQIVLRGANGERVVPADHFFIGPFQTAVAVDEILTEIRFPGLAGGVGAAYRNLEQPASGYSIVGAAAVVGRSGGQIVSARIGITGVADVAYRAHAVEDALVGRSGTQEDIAAAASQATHGQRVASDIHADREYRGRMAEVYTRRAIEAALARAG